MSKCTRGEFLGFGAALAGAFTLGGRPGAVRIAQPVPAQPAAGGEPDLILLNANPLKDIHNVFDQSGVMIRGAWFTKKDLESQYARYAVFIR